MAAVSVSVCVRWMACCVLSVQEVYVFIGAEAWVTDVFVFVIALTVVERLFDCCDRPSLTGEPDNNNAHQRASKLIQAVCCHNNTSTAFNSLGACASLCSFQP